MGDDNYYMLEALKEAQKAYDEGEIPVGAIIVNENGEIAGRGHNLKKRHRIPILHAEIVAILDAHRNRAGLYLTGYTMYTTLEPCPMCAAALVNERISRIVFAAEDSKYGACGSVYNITNDSNLNHRIHIKSRVMKEEASALLKRFFARLREKND